MGKRLGDYTRDNTKCMLEVNGVKLIDRSLATLKEIGVSRVILVVGYKGQNVKDYVGTDYQGIPIEYVDNPIYDKTNNIYSLYLAKDYMLADDTILLESDLIYESAVLKKLLADSAPDIALVDKYESWMDGTVVEIDEDHRITRFIDKERFKFEEIKGYYKTVNIYKFSKHFSSKYYVPFLAAYSTALGHNEYYEQVLKVILQLHDAPLKALPLTGETWYEIDDVQDLDIASGMFAPTDIKVSVPGIDWGNLSIMWTPVPVGVFAFILVGLCTSVMWGGIFNMAVEGLGKFTAAASGIFMTMVFGCAVMVALQALVADKVSILSSYWIPVACAVYILFYALIGSKPSKTEE